MNGLTAFAGGEDLDTYLLLILIFILIRSKDDSGMIFALGYLLISDTPKAEVRQSERRCRPSRVSKCPPPGGCRH